MEISATSVFDAFTRAVDAAQCLDAAKELFDMAGFSHVWLVSGRRGDRSKTVLLASTLPDEFIGPTVWGDMLDHAVQSGFPAVWNSKGSGRSAPPTAGSVVGLGHGLLIPLAGPGSMISVVGAGRVESAPGDGAYRALPIACLIALCWIRAAALATSGDESALTARERECLIWAAQGKTSWETARILDVAEVTVNFHLKNVVKKLGVANRVQAVAQAVTNGLIEL